jgi:L-cystine uptake protein TcyP (sodium:dicarboxylate symporter family)
VLTIDSTTLVLLTAVISAGSAFIGVLITSYFNLRTTRLAKESEERKHQKELVFNAAIENWKQTAELSKRSAVATELMPLDSFLVHMTALSDVLLDPTLTADNLKDRMVKVYELTKAMESAAKERSKQLNP